MPKPKRSQPVCNCGSVYDPGEGRQKRRTCSRCALPWRCRFEGCIEPIRTGQLCSTHYQRRRVHGDPSVFLPLDAWTRFHSSYDVEPATGCWLWNKGVNADGYAIVFADGKNHLAHRWAWIQRNGPVPGGRPLDHFKCDTPPCVNWDHVRPVTQRENVLRSNSPPAHNLAKTHCVNGHPFDEANTYYDSLGRRSCRSCRNKRHRDRYDREHPDHLPPGRERTHYPQGHPYDEANTYVYNGWRGCRLCRQQQDRARRRPRKSPAGDVKEAGRK